MRHHGLHADAKEVPPCKHCTGQCCTFAPMSLREFKTIRKRHGIPAGSTLIEIAEPRSVMLVKDPTTGTCAFLSNGRCSVYADRPWICRVYGESADFPCALAHPIAAQQKRDRLATMERWTGVIR